jgi:indole-3-glycerol phosphate synthase
MPENILQDIISKKKIRIAELKRKRPLENISEHMPDSMDYIDFKNKIEQNMQNNKLSIIAEIKKASPSAGILVEKYNPVDIAKIYYKNKATCLSVLTEEDFFLGSLSHIYKIKSLFNLMDPGSMRIPILCKDFFIDTYQVHLAKYYGADAILIILAGVNEKLADDLYEEALKLNMSVIVEVHTINEAKKSLNFKEALIGINNRNLKTLKTEINTTYDIYNILINHKGPLISESGIKTKEELLEIETKTKIKTFLIGESLLKNLKKNSIFSVL